MAARFEWEIASPEDQGMSASRLDAMREVLADRGTKGLLVIRGDRIVYEWYAPDHGPAKQHYTASLAKAIVGGMSLTLALSDGCIGADDPAWKYIPAWKDDPEKSGITIRHLATHSSGIQNAAHDDPSLKLSELPSWIGAFWRRKPDPFTVSRDQAPMIFSPGAEYHYSNPGMALLSYAVTASLKDTEHRDVRTLLRERVMAPIGVPDEEWSIGYGKTYEVEGLDLVANGGGGSYTARAVARVGRLMLRKGDWEGEQLIPSRWIEEVVQYAGTPLPDRPQGNPQPGSGLGWWTNFDGVWAYVPRDGFAGAGAGNQILLVVPSLDLIVVRNGAQIGEESEGEGFWGGVVKYLFHPLMDAIVEAPYPRSDVIREATFAPVSSIVRDALGMPGKVRHDGSDNWPMTWADDDHQYTAYGDGYGFEPYTDEKLGLGFARVSGSPADFQGVNIRSESGENSGYGRNGIKANGILMVEGVIYMWGRNARNAQLAWSTDYCRTWTWCDWNFTTSFGCATFLNFGRHYEGARDGYVYVYSQDAEDAYTPADRMVLARVPKDRIRDQEAYEFFKAFGAEGHPVWAEKIEERGGVFAYPGRCYRSGVTYNAGLGRYLLCKIRAETGDTRFEGGFGIYDASEPWGPWTTVYFTDKWDVGPGEACSLPTKWMSEDGKTCYLVSSGDDAFTVREVNFKVARD